jgi:hypothetical protein
MTDTALSSGRGHPGTPVRFRSDDEGLVFSMDGTRPLGDMTMTKVLRGLGHQKVTVHGFRSSFTDWAAEKTKTSRRSLTRRVCYSTRNAAKFMVGNSPKQSITPATMFLVFSELERMPPTNPESTFTGYDSSRRSRFCLSVAGNLDLRLNSGASRPS